MRVSGSGFVRWAVGSVLSLALLAGTGTMAERPGGFRIIGPGGGGATFHPTISPHDPETVLVSCDMGAGYITHNGGTSWREFNLRGGVTSFLFDPQDPKSIYAAGIGLWHSADNGLTWQLLAPTPGSVVGIANSSDSADEQILSTDTIAGAAGGKPGHMNGIAAMALDPLHPQHLYVAAGRTLWLSSDAGAHWTTGGDVPSRIWQMGVARKPGSNDDPVLWVGGQKGFFARKGTEMHTLPGPEGVADMTDTQIDVAAGKVTLLAVRDKSLYVATVEAGDLPEELMWKETTSVGTGSKINTAVSGHDNRTLYSSFYALQCGKVNCVGVAKSEDLGQTWKVIVSDSDLQGPTNIADQWVGPMWHDDPPLAMAVSEKNHNLVYWTDLGRTLKSTDGGAHWEALYAHKGPDGGAISNGLDLLTSYGVFFDPFDAKRMFIAYTDVSLMRSDNGGESWWRSSEGVPFRWHNTTYWMVFDPEVKGRVYSVMSGTHDLPRPRMWRGTPVDHFRGGAALSTDGGVHWKPLGTGMPNIAATHLLLDLASPVASRTLYVATMGFGVYKSVDGGATWVAKNNGLPEHSPLAWRLVMAKDRTLYVILARKSENGTIGDLRDGWVYRSKDQGESWQLLPLPEGVNGPTGLVIDPSDSQRMYLSAWPRDKGQNGLGGGIFTTTDGGEHWTLLFNFRQHIYDITMNPDNPNELYATGFESSAFHSTDRGVHWRRIVGYNFKAGHRIIPDPRHPGYVFICTFGGGVWYGRVDGEAAIEDIASKEIEPVTR